MAEQVTGRGFEDLKAWQLARQLMIECHQVADSLPAKERYDLAPQMRRSSKSVMANIAEGYGRYHYLDRLRFLYIARGSLNETINHVIAAHDLAYLADVRYKELCQLGREAERTLNGYINHIHRQRTGSDTYGDKYIPTPSEIPTPLEKWPTPPLSTYPCYQERKWTIHQNHTN